MLPGQGTCVISTGVHSVFADVEVLRDHFMLHDRSRELYVCVGDCTRGVVEADQGFFHVGWKASPPQKGAGSGMLCDSKAVVDGGIGMLCGSIVHCEVGVGMR